MAGVLVTVDGCGRIVRRFGLPDDPKKGYYPITCGDETTHFIKGVPLLKFRLGRFLNVTPPTVGHSQTLLQGETS